MCVLHQGSKSCRPLPSCNPIQEVDGKSAIESESGCVCRPFVPCRRRRRPENSRRSRACPLVRHGPQRQQHRSSGLAVLHCYARSACGFVPRRLPGAFKRPVASSMPHAPSTAAGAWRLAATCEAVQLPSSSPSSGGAKRALTYAGLGHRAPGQPSQPSQPGAPAPTSPPTLITPTPTPTPSPSRRWNFLSLFLTSRPPTFPPAPPKAPAPRFCHLPPRRRHR